MGEHLSSISWSVRVSPRVRATSLLDFPSEAPEMLKVTVTRPAHSPHVLDNPEVSGAVPVPMGSVPLNPHQKSRKAVLLLPPCFRGENRGTACTVRRSSCGVCFRCRQREHRALSLLFEEAELKEVNTESPAGFSVSSPGPEQRGPVLSLPQVSAQPGWPRCLWRGVRRGGASETWGFD